jgi:hypothetical protein
MKFWSLHMGEVTVNAGGEKMRHIMPVLKDWCFRAWLVASVISISLPSFASAQILEGENFPITTAPEFESGSSVAANTANGEFLVVWHNSIRISDDPPAFRVETLGQRVSSSGALVGERILVTPAAAGNPALGGFNPKIAFNSKANEFFVVYDRNYFGSVNNGIFGQRVAADGSLIGSEAQIFAGNSQGNAAIAYDSISDEFLIVWSQSAGGVRARIVNAEGTPVTNVVDLSTGLSGAGNPKVVFNEASNQYFVVFDAFAVFPSITDVFGQRVNADGTLDGPIFPITAANGIQAFPSVALNPVVNQYLVVWGDGRNAGVTFGDIYGQLVNADGSLAGENVPMSTFPFDEGAPSIAYAPASNQYMAVWMGQTSGAPGNVNIYGRLFASDASPIGGAFQVSDAGYAQAFTSVAVDPPTNIFLSVWPDERNGGSSNTDIFGQLIAVPIPAIQVAIDIKPGNGQNSINPNSFGVIPVAMLASETFDVTTVDPATVRFGATGSEASPVHAALEDINADGKVDLIFQFRVQDTHIHCGETSASLTGKTLDGQKIEGSDLISTVGCR